MNRYRIIGAIALVWGMALLLSHLLGFRRIEGSGAYAAGQYAGLLFGVLLFAVGLYAVITGGRKKS
jgi:Mn2+/Fe2+ NRAMP family transporter